VRETGPKRRVSAKGESWAGKLQASKS